MKKIFIFMFTLFLSTSVMADTLKVTINGMVCAFCANGVEKKFKKIDKVKTVDVNLETKIVTVDFDGEVKPTDEEITKIINGAGYQVASIKRIVK